MEARTTTCIFCDGGCQVTAEIHDDGKMKVRPANPDFPAICRKANMIDEYRLHPDRLTKPLRRVGERGSGKWEEVSWGVALDEIADKLKVVIDEYGPESFAMAEMPLNIGLGGIGRRFMNHLGAVNYTAPVQLCMGNTAQVHRLTYGWMAFANWSIADCVIYFGQDRDGERWPGEYINLKRALERGAVLIEVDPRETETAKLAQHHLRIRYGTDAALVLAWLNVIIAEGLYDKEFVESQCVGFEELAERASAWTPERASEVCGIPAEQIIETARVIGNASAPVIPWGVVGDMQVNSTSLLHAQCILRAVTGALGKSEMVFGPMTGFIPNAKVSEFGVLTPSQREKQLGRDTRPLLTFRTSDLYKEACERAGLDYEPDIIGESCAADPADMWAAMRGEGPYPVKAFFSAGNNTVMSYAGQVGIEDAFLNCDLVVTFENWMTPTAQLSDYVLPGDMWAERDVLSGPFDAGPALNVGRAFFEPVGKCKNWYWVMKQLACRLGIGDAFPWEDERELHGWRLAPSGLTFEEAAERVTVLGKPAAPGTWLTPSGKVELKSSVLEALGFDPLPDYVEPKDPGAEAAGRDEGGRPVYPYDVFAGYRERANYNTNLRQIPSLRKCAPEPQFYINPADAELEGVAEGEWCRVSTAYGEVQLQCHIDDAQPAGSLRVPHGWWKPEVQGGLGGGLSGASLYNDGMLFPDADWMLDPAQGVPGLRGSLHARVDKLHWHNSGTN
ncbi:molybdopterin-containing oxidoreductase family protein [Ellagibacter sp.]|uniref:molybdopterin-containing oxidoreductase family protein n=1 Tax=Ellagibacter sp. TaxID=2137578 RepID=UPI003AB8762D